MPATMLTKDVNIISFFDAWHTSLSDVNKVRRKRSSDVAGLSELEWKDWDNIDLDDDRKEQGGVVADQAGNAELEARAKVSEGAATIKEQLALEDGNTAKVGLAVLALFDYNLGWSGDWEEGAAERPSGEGEASTSESVCADLVTDILEDAMTRVNLRSSKKQHREGCIADFSAVSLAAPCLFFCRALKGFFSGSSATRTYKRELTKKSKRKQIQEWKKRKMEKKQKESTEIWLSKILPNWYSIKDDPWVKLSWRQGLPPAVRGLVWPLALGNTLRITEELYNYYTSQASLEIDEGKMIASFEASTKLILDELVSSDVYVRRLRTATKMAMGKQEAMLQIEQDIHRTFSNLKLFKPGSDLHGHLRTVLGAFVIHRPDVGYVQGMSYLAGMFLLYMDPPEAFMCLCNLLTRHFFLAFLSADTDHVYSMFRLFSSWLKTSMPQIHRHFEAIHLGPELYLLNWAFTMYAKILPLDTACLVWDNYMLEGELTIFKTALALLKMHKTQLLGCSFDQAIKLLLQPPEDLDPDVFLKTINNIVVPDRIAEAFASMERKYYAPKLEIGGTPNGKNGRSPARLRVPSSPASFQRNI